MVKVFIDGKEGTTGLKIYERFANRKDIVLLELSDNLRKDTLARKDMINQSDITFLCLPDDAAREAVTLIENDKVRIIDASTAHRANPDWAYGFPELSEEHRSNIKKGNKVAVPGCHASGFLALVYPLVKLGIMPNNYPVVCHSLTGYSGGGKKMIAEYQTAGDISPRQYSLSQEHKHLKEMQCIAGLTQSPLFSPVVCNYYSGMEVTVPIFANLLKGNLGAKEIHEAIADYYMSQKMIQVMPFGVSHSGMLDSSALSGSNTMQIYISGNSERILTAAIFDNLGKGASGAAVQCMNIMLNLPDDYNL